MRPRQAQPGGGAGARAPASTPAPPPSAFSPTRATAGGGGRIAVYYRDAAAFDFPHIRATGGIGSRAPGGGAGTAYLRDSDEPGGVLVVDSLGEGIGVTPLDLDEADLSAPLSSVVLRG